MTQQEKEELKKKEVASENKEEEDKKPAGKKIEVDADLLKQLLQELKETKATVEQLSSNAVAQSPGLQVRRKTRDFDYKVRKWEGKIVLGYENVGTEKRPLEIYLVYNKETRKEEQFVNLILKDVAKPVVKVPYNHFLQDGEKIVCRLISKVVHEEVKESGMIHKKEMAENGYGMFETMVLVPIEETSESFTGTLKLPEDEGGEEIIMHSSKLNI